MLTIGTDAEGNSCNANNDSAHDGGVGPPVGRLTVPTTGGGPDFLGIPVARYVSTTGRYFGVNHAYGIFPPPPIVTEMQLKVL